MVTSHGTSRCLTTFDLGCLSDPERGVRSRVSHPQRGNPARLGRRRSSIPTKEAYPRAVLRRNPAQPRGECATPPLAYAVVGRSFASAPFRTSWHPDARSTAFQRATSAGCWRGRQGTRRAALPGSRTQSLPPVRRCAGRDRHLGLCAMVEVTVMVLPTSGCLLPEGQSRMSDLAGFLVARFAEDSERAGYVHHETCETFDEVSTPLSPPACDCGMPPKAMVDIGRNGRLSPSTNALVRRSHRALDRPMTNYAGSLPR
ncbi:hypothetical protein HEB94_000217 [Actinopolymorpha pittospori]|uniref:Uncharacterized protein n=1 Tax=Actinopolymorpha pittospori TaxID=648752 RepID=A0A927MMQ3_9ACTN|nr:hypothetical protein [Actinopolymorpha pittospori]